MPLDERVLVIPESHFRSVGYFEGFRPADDEYRERILDADQYLFLPRSECETQPEFKQLIPYVVLTSSDAVFHYRRSAKGTEARLTAKRSIGIGGHITEADAAGDGDPYRIGMARELAEEIEIGEVVRSEFLGFIYDPSTPVGCVHLGIVHRFELARPEAHLRDEALHQPGFSSLKRLEAELVEFETWSQFTLAQMQAASG